MEKESVSMNLMQLITQDKKFLFTIISYMSAVTIFLNVTIFQSLIVGIVASIVYLFINSAFLGESLSQDENRFTRFLLGLLLIIATLGLVGWTVMILYNLDSVRTMIALLVATSLASILNQWMKSRTREEMPPNGKEVSKTVRAVDAFYLVLLIMALYLLYLSRRDEVFTVWGVIQPVFIPTFIISTFVLLIIIFSAERVEYKLLFTTFHSILSHSLMILIFPAGKVGAQQTILGLTRRVFDNIIFHGFGWTRESLQLKLYVSFRGENFQTVFSVIFARMLGVDVYWTHLLLVPLLWGAFVPLIAFMITKSLSGNERISVLAALLTLLFPTTVLWGADSIPNGLGYLFFFCFVFFLFGYIKNDKLRNFLPVLVFLFATGMSHFLAGTMAVSLFLLAYGFKTYEKEKQNSSRFAKSLLLVSFIFSASIMPFALVYRNIFYHTANTIFSIERVCELPPTELIFSILFGRYYDLISREAYISTLAYGLPVIVSFIALLYVLKTSRRGTSENSIRSPALFLLLSLVMLAIEDRIVSLLLTNVPFVEIDRLWVFRDFLLVPFAALFMAGALAEIRASFERISRNVYLTWLRASAINPISKRLSFFTRGHLSKGISIGTLFSYLSIFLVVSFWVNASIFYAYPHWGPLQTTSYELEAVKYIEKTTKENYIVVSDAWIIFAGQMFVGSKNPRAFYFPHTDPIGVSLFIKMKTKPTNETLLEAASYNNATVVYFVIDKPRLGTQEYNRIIRQAQENNLQTYPGGVFNYESEEKIHIFYYKRI